MQDWLRSANNPEARRELSDYGKRTTDDISQAGKRPAATTDSREPEPRRFGHSQAGLATPRGRIQWDAYALAVGIKRRQARIPAAPRGTRRAAAP